MKYEELAHENHEENSEFDEVGSKMEDMTSEMQGAFRYIQERNQTSDTCNRRAQNLREDNQAIMNVASELQMRMLHDENSNMLEVAQREGERER